MPEKVKIALITAVASIITTVVTALVAVPPATRRAVDHEKQEIIKDVTGRVSVTGIPIGTVVPSIFEPRAFSTLVGDEGGFSATQSIWVPADGRDVAGSRYSKLLTSKVPDLRGLFIRGLNHSEPDRNRLTESDGKSWADPDGANRKAGDLQADTLGAHQHSATGVHPIATSSSGFWALSGQDNDTEQPRLVHLTGGPETRPKNIALYYYVKIN